MRERENGLSTKGHNCRDDKIENTRVYVSIGEAIFHGTFS